jgi:pimeloyl-ACP methyl ester carboxylesterase
MATFGLVHGAMLGAWCWERLVPELEARGHRAVAMDLPCEDPAAGCVRYAEVAAAALPPADDLVLVGHSLGGLTIPLVAARRPARALVFLCAALPALGQSLDDQLAADRAMYAEGFAAHPGRVIHADGSVSWSDPTAVREALYHDCTPDDARRAWSRLRRQSLQPRRERCPLTAWPDPPRASILCRDDRAIAPAWSRRAARERLGVEALELPGSHSPFLSRPAELATMLDALAARFV